MSHSITVSPIATRIPYYMAGAKVANVSQAIAKVGFDIIAEPGARFSTGEAIPNTKDLFRSDNGICLGRHGADYTFIQPSESLEVLEKSRSALCDAGFNAQWTSVRTVNEGRSLAAFITLNKEIKAPKRGDAMSLFVSWQESFDGTGRRNFALGLNVLACTNGAMSRKNLCAYRAKHTKNSNDTFKVWQGSLAMNLQMEIQAMESEVTKLDATPMSLGEVEPFTRRLLGIEASAKREDISAQALGKLDAIVTGFTRGTGNEGRTRCRPRRNVSRT